MLIDIWNNRLTKKCHVVVKPKDFQSFTSWLASKGCSIQSRKSHHESLIYELVSIELPHLRSHDSGFQERVKFWESAVKDGYGYWIYYPWNETAIWLPEEKEFFKIRTSRNKHLITESEQTKLLTANIGIIGLSVGNSIASALAMECCGGELRLADFDKLDLTNLNRIRASILQLGESKTRIAYQTLAELNPFLQIEIWEEGLTENNVDEFLSGLDLVIEECDSLDIKVLTRERARALKIPVIMETADRGMIDIERFDLEPDRPIFHGLAGNLTVQQLKGLTTEEKVPYVLPLVGGEELSTRMKASMLEINKTIKSWPQLGAQVQMGSGLCADLARKILLNQITTSGRFYFDTEGTIRSQNPTWYITHESYSAPGSFVDLKSCLDHAKKSGDVSTIPFPEERIFRNWIEKACLAPTGGNMQHWWWIKIDETLYLYEDAERSFSFLNFRNSGSNFGFGAALANLELAAWNEGYQLEVVSFPDTHFPSCIARISVLSTGNERISEQLDAFYQAIEVRCTDRRAQGALPDQVDQVFSQLAQWIEQPGFNLHYSIEDEVIRETSNEVGLADRLRLLNPHAHADFLAEMRWTEQENWQKRDGIDLATCYLKPSDLAVLSLAKDRSAFDFLEEQQLGLGLGELTAKLVRESPGLGLLTSKNEDHYAYLQGGAISQKIWLRLNGLGISFQPVSPITFLYLRNRHQEDGLKPWQRKLLTESEKNFKQIWNLEAEEKPLFLFRFFTLPTQPVRSLRRSLDEVYFNHLSG